MIHTIIESNALLYVMTAVGLLGILCQIIGNRCYRVMMRESVDTQAEKGEFLKRIQYRYQIDKRRSGGNVNIPVFVQKMILDYRYKKLSIHQWKRLGAGLFLGCIVIAAAQILYCRHFGFAMDTRIFLEGIVFWSLISALTVLWCDSRYKEARLSLQMQDYLYHSGMASELSEVNLEEQKEAESRMPSVIGLRRKSESKAKRDKRELQENLARMKEGTREVAAESEGSRNRERGRELLRQMDEKEQERIIRDVLEEFLA